MSDLLTKVEKNLILRIVDNKIEELYDILSKKHFFSRGRKSTLLAIEVWEKTRMVVENMDTAVARREGCDE